MNMAIVGGAILPVIQGTIADQVGLHHGIHSPRDLLSIYLVLPLIGSKPNSQRYTRAEERSLQRLAKPRVQI